MIDIIRGEPFMAPPFFNIDYFCKHIVTQIDKDKYVCYNIIYKSGRPLFTFALKLSR